MNNIFRYITLIVAAIILFACTETQFDSQLDPEFDKIVNRYITTDHCIDNLESDAIIYPVPWTKEIADTFTVTEAKVKNISTCGLIQSYYYQPWNILGPWCNYCSDFTLDGIQFFNDGINDNIVLNELFKREFVLNKLITTYISFIQDLSSTQDHPGRLHSYEILLASKKMDNIYLESTSTELIILCLKMLEEKKESFEFNNQNSFAVTRHIIVDVLIRNEFEPFLSSSQINGTLERNLNGFAICYDGEKVENYARLYLNNQKK